MSESWTTGSRRRSATRISASMAAATLRPITVTARVIGCIARSARRASGVSNAQSDRGA